jgi:3-oxoacyl-[acyl-carrier-protein] synthase-3
MQEVYINKTAIFLPNEPVSNDEIEDYMGLIGGNKSRAKAIVLRNNGIKTRYYALDKSGVPTHTNAEMTALAIRNLLGNSEDELKRMDLLCIGTSSPDQMMPSHGVEVHGQLHDSNAIEVITPSGNCCAGMHALKYAYLSVATGGAKYAVSAGSERTSKLLHANMFAGEAESLKDIDEEPYIAFEKDFLRWMLSDGAGAFLMTNKKNENDLSLRVDWIEGVSYANEVEACMYMACEKGEDGNLISFKDFTPNELIDQSIFSIKQDVKLLRSNIISLGFTKLKEIFKSKSIRPEDIDYFIPHMSSEFFRSKISDALIANDMHIPQDKWFTNLSSKGNVGAASVYLMIDELMKSGSLKIGEKILIAVPESARFSYVFASFTVV